MKDQEKKNPEIANYYTTFLSSKNPPFEKRTSSNEKTKVTFTVKQARKIFRTSDQNHGLTPCKIFKLFDYSKMPFLWSKKPPFEKTTSLNDKTKVTLRKKKT